MYSKSTLIDLSLKYLYPIGLYFFALGLRSQNLIERGFWYDEIGLWMLSLTNFDHSVDGPLSALVLNLWMQLWGNTSSIVAHLCMAFVGSITPVVIYYVVKKQVHAKAAIFVSLLGCTLPPWIILSQEVRPYSIYLLLSVLLVHYFLEVVKDTHKKTLSKYATIIFLCALTTPLTSQLLISFFILMLYMLFKPIGDIQLSFKAFIKICLAQCVGSLGVAWIYFQRFTALATLQGLYPESTILFFRQSLRGMSTEPIRLAILGSDWLMNDLFGIVFLALAIGGTIYAFKKSKQLITILALVTLSVTLFITFVSIGEKAYWGMWQRYLSSSFFAYLLLMGFGLTAIYELLKNKIIASICISFLFIPVALSNIDLYNNMKGYGWEEHYLQFTQHIDDSLVDLNGVVFDDVRVPNIFHYHRKNEIPIYFFMGFPGPAQYRFLDAMKQPTFHQGTQIIRPSEFIETLKPGIYAVYSRYPYFFKNNYCKFMGDQMRAQGLYTETLEDLPFKDAHLCEVKKLE